MYEWDERKAAANPGKHGVAFEAIYGFGWRDSVEVADGRFDYGEERFLAIGWLKGELHRSLGALPIGALEESPRYGYNADNGG